MSILKEMCITRDTIRDKGRENICVIHVKGKWIIATTNKETLEAAFKKLFEKLDIEEQLRGRIVAIRGNEGEEILNLRFSNMEEKNGLPFNVLLSVSKVDYWIT